MLRRILAEEGGSGRVAGVLLTERLVDVGDSTVSIDARAALLLSVFSWAQLCLAEAIAREELEEAGGGKFLGEMGIADEATVMVAEHSESGTKLPDEGPVNAPDRAEDRQKVVPAVEVEDVAGVASDNGGRTNVAHAVEANVAGGVSDVVDAEGGSLREDTAAGEAAILGDAPSEPDKRENSNTMIRALALLEMIGRGVRVVFAPEGRVRFAIDCSIGVISTGLGILRRCVVRGGGGEGGSRQVLVYDTDDEESYRWLAAQMLRHGWVVRRAGHHHDTRKTPDRFGGRGDRDVPVLVHRCSDEETLTAAAGHLSRGAKRPPVCAVVHRWDSGAEARRLLLGGGRGETGAREEDRYVSTAVICTAEVGEDLFRFVRGQLQSGASPEQVQEVVDDLFGSFYDAGPNVSRENATNRSRVGA
eukprot:jgi/Undpi1/1286/HiC_scaffold_11.g04678.m1